MRGGGSFSYSSCSSFLLIQCRREARLGVAPVFAVGFPQVWTLNTTSVKLNTEGLGTTTTMEWEWFAVRCFVGLLWLRSLNFSGWHKVNIGNVAFQPLKEVWCMKYTIHLYLNNCAQFLFISFSLHSSSISGIQGHADQLRRAFEDKCRPGVINQVQL